MAGSFCAGAAALLSSGLFQSEQEMPDEDDKKTAKPAEAAGKAPEGPEGEVSASEEGGDADQDAMMAEWEAMAAEGEAEPEGEAAPEAAAPAAGAAKPALRMPAIHEDRKS